jgi:hypothetical protein
MIVPPSTVRHRESRLQHHLLLIPLVLLRSLLRHVSSTLLRIPLFKRQRQLDRHKLVCRFRSRTSRISCDFDCVGEGSDATHRLICAPCWNTSLPNCWNSVATPLSKMAGRRSTIVTSTLQWQTTMNCDGCFLIAQRLFDKAALLNVTLRHMITTMNNILIVHRKRDNIDTH